MPTRSQHSKELANQPALVGFSDADVARGLQADNRVEGCVREIERPRVSSLDKHAIGEAMFGYQLMCLAHLLTADVHSGDTTSTPPGESERRGGKATAHVPHAVGAL